MIVIGLEHLYICKQTARKNGLFVCFRPKTELIEVEVLARRLASMDPGCDFFFLFYHVSWLLRESDKSVSILVRWLVD